MLKMSYSGCPGPSPTQARREPH